MSSPMDDEPVRLTRNTVSLLPASVIKYMLRSGKCRERASRSQKVEKDTAAIPFPVEVMDGFAKNFAVTYSRTLEPRPPAFYMSAITCLGSLLAGNVKLNSELLTDPRLYVVFIGESGAAKKSTAALKTIEFFRDSVRTFRSCQGAGSAEGLFNEINSVKWDRRIVLFYDEFQQFVNKCKIESSVLLQMVNILFESNRYESPLKNSKMKLDYAYLSMLSASTEETYDECWTSTFTNIGFNNRLFVVPIVGGRMHSIPPAVSNIDKERLKEELEAILGMVGTGKVYDITEDGYEYYDKWYMGLGNDTYTKRIDSYALRFMPLLAANEMKTVVDLDIVKKAITLCSWQIEVRKRYEPTVADNPYAAMEARIRKLLLEGGYSRRELQIKSHAYRVGIKTYLNALSNMVDMGEIYLGTDNKYHLTKGGR